jgi:hypothetical protein
MCCFRNYTKLVREARELQKYGNLAADAEKQISADLSRPREFLKHYAVDPAQYRTRISFVILLSHRVPYYSWEGRAR